MFVLRNVVVVENDLSVVRCIVVVGVVTFWASQFFLEKSSFFPSATSLSTKIKTLQNFHEAENLEKKNLDFILNRSFSTIVVLSVRFCVWNFFWHIFWKKSSEIRWVFLNKNLNGVIFYNMASRLGGDKSRKPNLTLTDVSIAPGWWFFITLDCQTFLSPQKVLQQSHQQLFFHFVRRSSSVMPPHFSSLRSQLSPCYRNLLNVAHTFKSNHTHSIFTALNIDADFPTSPLIHKNGHLILSAVVQLEQESTNASYSSMFE